MDGDVFAVCLLVFWKGIADRGNAPSQHNYDVFVNIHMYDINIRISCAVSAADTFLT